MALLALAMGAASATTITGTIKYPNGATFSGTVTFTLSAPAGAGGDVLVPGVSVQVVAGSLPANFTLQGNDVITPAGTYYAVKYYGPYGNLVMTNNYVITGSTYDLGASVPTPVTTNHLNYLDLTGLRSLSATTATVGSLNRIAFASLDCSTPGVYDETCLNNAIWGSGPGELDGGAGEVVLGAYVYTIHHPVVLHGDLALVGAGMRASVIGGDGSADFSATGMLRYCSNEACSAAPVNNGAWRAVLRDFGVAIDRSADLGLNLYGLSDSYVVDVEVYSEDNAVPGWGTCAEQNSDTAVSSYRDTFVNFRCYETSVGLVLGNLGSGNPVNADHMTGGLLYGNPALQIANGTDNVFEAVSFSGDNANGDTLVVAGNGTANQNVLSDDYFDDGLGSGKSAYAVQIDSGSIGNVIWHPYLDPEGGTMTVSDGGAATVQVPLPSGATPYLSCTTSPGLCTLTGAVGNGAPERLGLANPSTYNSGTQNDVGIQSYLNDASNVAVNPFYMTTSLSNGTHGSSTGYTEIGGLVGGTEAKFLGCGGADGFGCTGGYGTWDFSGAAAYKLPASVQFGSAAVTGPPASGTMALTSQLDGVGSLTTTSATSDTVTLTWPDGGTRTPGHCELAATGSSAASNIATTYISGKASNQVTVTHTATSGMTYDVVCTAD